MTLKMKNRIYIACLIFSYIMLYASKPVLSKEKEKGKNISTMTPVVTEVHSENINPVWGFYADASPGIVSIKINNLASDIWKTESNFAYNFSAGYFYSVHPLLRIKGGIGVSSYKASLTGSGEIESQQLADIDNDTYIENLTVLNAKHNINPMYLTVPLIFEFGTANLSKLGYYLDIGFEYSYLINENNTSTGSYTTKGNYPQWAVTLENVPELGFFTERNLESELRLKKSIYSIRGGAGITIPISGLLIFKLGIVGYMGLNSVGKSQYTSDENNSISQQTSDFRSDYIYNPLATSSGNKARRLGIEFGLYFCKRVN